MFTTLRKIAGGTAVIPMRPQAHQNGGTASLPKLKTCHICGGTLRLSRFVNLHPTGVRGYYADVRGHVVAIDRSNVTRNVGSDAHRLYFR
jgi:hypothetical protein